MKKYLLVILSCLLLVGCHVSKQPAETFKKFLEETFKEEMSENYISCHLDLKNPEKLGIKFSDKDINFGQLLEDDEKTKERLKTLETYKDVLEEDEQVYYKSLHQSWEYDLELSDEKYNYIYNVCDPLTSETSSISTILLEFPFYQEQDIKDYITLISHTGDYCDQIIDYLNKQSEKGLFMPKKAADAYIETVEQFINQDEDPLLRSFDAYDFTFELTNEQKTKYKELIDEQYKNTLIPSFKKIIDTVKSLKKTSKNQKGLYYLKNGKEYYKKRIASILGDDISIKDIKSLMRKRMASAVQTLYKYYNCSKAPKTKYQNYKEILSDLETMIKENFPSIDKVDYKVTDMDQSNALSGNTAYYMTPPLDDVTTNIIRVNNTSSSIDISSLDTFSTLAHEGFPGHLYQFNYSIQHKVPYLLSLHYYLGYSEGYATYVQYLSYDYLNISRPYKEYQLAQEALTYGLIVLSDIGIHYEGWDINDMVKLYKRYGYNASASDLEGQYSQLLYSPAIFIPYHVGCALLEKDKAYMKKKLGKKYQDKTFHEVILKYGNLPLSLVEENIKAYIKKN